MTTSKSATEASKDTALRAKENIRILVENVVGYLAPETKEYISELVSKAEWPGMDKQTKENVIEELKSLGLSQQKIGSLYGVTQGAVSYNAKKEDAVHGSWRGRPAAAAESGVDAEAMIMHERSGETGKQASVALRTESATEESSPENVPKVAAAREIAQPTKSSEAVLDSEVKTDAASLKASVYSGLSKPRAQRGAPAIETFLDESLEKSKDDAYAFADMASETMKYFVSNIHGKHMQAWLCVVQNTMNGVISAALEHEDLVLLNGAYAKLASVLYKEKKPDDTQADDNAALTIQYATVILMPALLKYIVLLDFQKVLKARVIR